MKHYEHMKDSGVEWIGEIPEHWEFIPLKFISYMKGRIGWRGLKQDEFTEEGPYLVTGHDIQNRRIDWSECYHISQDRYDESPEIQLREGDLLFTKDGTIGKTLYIDKLPGLASLNSHLLLIRPESNRYNSKFLEYIFQTPYYYSFIELNKTGTTFFGISQTSMENFRGLFPPKEEQTQIVAFLDEKTSKIDSLITKKERKIELLNEQRKALINQAVTKGLDPTVPMKDSGVEWIGKIPEGWAVISLKHFSNVVLGKMLTKEPKNDYVLKSYLRSQNIQVESVDISDVKKMWFNKDELKNLLVKENDILVSEGGDIGRTCIWKEELEEIYIQNSVHKITILNGSSEYFHYQFQRHYFTGYFESIVNRVSIPHLTKEKLSNVKFVVPPITEQKKIEKHLDKSVVEIDNLINRESKKIKLLREYRQSLISEVVTGKVDVSNYAKASLEKQEITV